MAIFNFVPTKSGRALFAEVQAGAVLIPTKFVIGTGSLPSGSNLADLTAAVSPLKEFAVTERRSTPDGTCIFGGVYTNADIADDFYLREICLFARAEYRDDSGAVTQNVAEVLLIAGNSGDTADQIPGQSTSGSILERRIRIPVIVGNDVAVDVTLDSGLSVPLDLMGAAEGVATLDENGKLVRNQWPAITDMGGVPVSGGTMYGPLNMGGKNITNLGTPTSDGHAVNKLYADAIKKIAENALKLIGGTMQGPIDMGNFKITGLADPTDDADAVNKKFAEVIRKVAAAALPKTGGTMTGDINMGGKKISSLGAPTASGDAVNKEYADKIKDTAEGAFPKSGGTVSGDMYVDGTLQIRNTGDYVGLSKMRTVNGETYSLDIGIGSDVSRGASLSFRLRDGAGTVVGRVDAWANGTFTYSNDGTTYRDIYNSSRMIVLTEGVHYGDTLPAAGNKGRLFFKRA